MAIYRAEGLPSECCDEGRRYVEQYSPSRFDWVLWPADGGTEYHEVRFCPFCGHRLSEPTAPTPEGND